MKMIVNSFSVGQQNLFIVGHFISHYPKTKCVFLITENLYKGLLQNRRFSKQRHKCDLPSSDTGSITGESMPLKK